MLQETETYNYILDEEEEYKYFEYDQISHPPDAVINSVTEHWSSDVKPQIHHTHVNPLTHDANPRPQTHNTDVISLTFNTDEGPLKHNTHVGSLTLNTDERPLTHTTDVRSLTHNTDVRSLAHNTDVRPLTHNTHMRSYTHNTDVRHLTHNTNIRHLTTDVRSLTDNTDVRVLKHTTDVRPLLHNTDVRPLNHTTYARPPTHNVWISPLNCNTGIIPPTHSTDVSFLTHNTDMRPPTQSTDVRSLTHHTDLRPQTHNIAVRSLTQNTDVRSLTHNTDVRSLTHKTDVRSLTHNTDVRSLTNNTDVRSPTHNTDARSLTHSADKDADNRKFSGHQTRKEEKQIRKTKLDSIISKIVQSKIDIKSEIDIGGHKLEQINPEIKVEDPSLHSVLEGISANDGTGKQCVDSCTQSCEVDKKGSADKISENDILSTADSFIADNIVIKEEDLSNSEEEIYEYEEPPLDSDTGNDLDDVISDKYDGTPTDCIQTSVEDCTSEKDVSVLKPETLTVTEKREKSDDEDNMKSNSTKNDVKYLPTQEQNEESVMGVNLLESNSHSEQNKSPGNDLVVVPSQSSNCVNNPLEPAPCLVAEDIKSNLMSVSSDNTEKSVSPSSSLELSSSCAIDDSHEKVEDKDTKEGVIPSDIPSGKFILSECVESGSNFDKKHIGKRKSLRHKLSRESKKESESISSTKKMQRRPSRNKVNRLKSSSKPVKVPLVHEEQTVVVKAELVENVAKTISQQLEREHKEKSLKKKTACCEICGKKFYRRPELRRHLRIHSGERPFSCESCDKTFGQKYHLRRHMRNVHGSELTKLFECGLCNNNFDDNYLLERHMRSHGTGLPFRCEICWKLFTTKRSMKEHIMTRHVGIKPYSCPKCDKKFARKFHMERHMGIHTGDKPYNCDYCGRAFLTRGNMNAHTRRIHLKEKPYTCGVCSKNFFTKKCLQSHFKTHTGERPHQCEICEKRFSQRQNLVSHLRIHSGDRPYKCDTCGKCYTRISHLRRHMNDHKKSKFLMEEEESSDSSS